MNVRRRFITVLLVLLIVLLPVSADVDWTIGKVLGDVPHNDLSYPYVSSMTKGTVVRNVLPYTANLELAIEHEADAFHPVSFTLFLYGNPHNYTPVALTSTNVEVSISDGTSGTVAFKAPKGIENRVLIQGQNALTFSNVLCSASDHVYVTVKENRDTYTFKVDTRTLSTQIQELMNLSSDSQNAVTVLNPVNALTSFGMKTVLYIMNDSELAPESIEHYLTYVFRNFPECHDKVVENLKKIAVEDWLADYKEAYDVDFEDSEKLQTIRDGIKLERAKELPSTVARKPEPEPEPVPAPVVGPDGTVLPPAPAEGEDVIVPDELPLPEPEEEVADVNHNYFGFKTYGFGPAFFIPTEYSTIATVGASLDMDFVGQNHGGSVELAYVYDTGTHEFELGAGYIYKLRASEKIEWDFEIGAIANIINMYGHMGTAPGEGLCFGLGVKGGVDFDWLITDSFFLNASLDCRAIVPRVGFAGFVPSAHCWEINPSLGIGFGFAL